MTTAATPLLLTVGADQATNKGDTVFDAGGAPVLNAGLLQFYNRIARLLVAQQVLGSPGAGAGLSTLLGQPFTPQREQAALAAAQRTILADPLCSGLVALTISMPTQGQVRVDATIGLIGQPADSPPVSLIWLVGL